MTKLITSTIEIPGSGPYGRRKDDFGWTVTPFENGTFTSLNGPVEPPREQHPLHLNPSRGPSRQISPTRPGI